MLLDMQNFLCHKRSDFHIPLNPTYAIPLEQAHYLLIRTYANLGCGARFFVFNPLNPPYQGDF